MSFDPIARGLAAKAGSDAAKASADSARASADAATLGKSSNTAQLIGAMRANGFFPLGLGRAPAADIPVVSLGAAGANSALNARAAGNPLVLASDPRIQWLSGPTALDATGAWRPRGAWYGATLGRASQYAAIEFSHTGTDLELSLFGSFAAATGNLRVLVNDRIVTVQSLPSATGSHHFLRLTFPAAATRRIRIEGASGKFRGINVGAAAEITATGRTYPLISVMGDSFAEGTGATWLQDGQGAALVRALGGRANLAGVGGTGLISPGTGGKVAWTEATRITDLTLAGVTDALGYPTLAALGIVMMSLSDVGAAAASWSAFGASFQDAVNNRVGALIDAWQTANPGKPLVFFGPTWNAESPALDIYRIRDAVQEACWAAASANVWFIDRLAPGTLLRRGTRTSLGVLGNTIVGSPIVTGLSSTLGVAAQSGLVCASIPAGARVQSVDTATQVTLDVAATATATATSVTFLNDHAAMMTALPGDATNPSQAGHSLDALWMAGQLRNLITGQFA